jgi:hypothetical protein
MTRFIIQQRPPMTRFIIQQRPPMTSLGGGQWSYASGPWVGEWVGQKVAELRAQHPALDLRVVTTSARF